MLKRGALMGLCRRMPHWVRDLRVHILYSPLPTCSWRISLTLAVLSDMSRYRQTLAVAVVTLFYGLLASR